MSPDVNAVKYKSHSIEKLQVILWSHMRWEHIACDHICPLVASKVGKSEVLLSESVEIFPLRDASALLLVKTIRNEILTRYGGVVTLVLDNATCFTAHEFVKITLLGTNANHTSDLLLTQQLTRPRVSHLRSSHLVDLQSGQDAVEVELEKNNHS
ncbi:hypothetical protein B566_EDAN011063 [Ephemera danica]|nr:hypothetical protein B566_EDAN011063 [Ephemera danica]